MTPVQQGQLATVELRWTARQQLPGGLAVSLHVVDSQGTLWAGHDDQPRAGYNPTGNWTAGQVNRDIEQLLLPAGIPPGEYTVTAGWYNLTTKQTFGPQNVPIGALRVTAASHADIAALHMPNTLSADLGGGLQLLGYDMPANAVVGDTLPLRLFWQTNSQPSGDYSLLLAFAGKSQTVPLPPTHLWQAGTIAETRTAVALPPSWAGAGNLQVGLINTSAGQSGSPQPAACPAPGAECRAGSTVTLPQNLTVSALKKLTALPPGLEQPVNATLAGTVQLTGYTASIGGVQGRASVTLTLYWKALRTVPADLHVFAHILNDRGQVVAQHDGVPGDGHRPTGGWSTDEYIEDRHVIELDSIPNGPLQVEVGLYSPSTGERLGDRLLLQQVTFNKTS